MNKKQQSLIFKDFSIAGILKQWEYENKLGELIKNSDAFDSLGNIYVGNNIVPKPSSIGCKTETRRTRGLDEINENPQKYSLNKKGHIENNEGSFYQFFDLDTLETIEIKCPWGVIGDEIYVKEAYSYLEFDKNEKGVHGTEIYKADGKTPDWGWSNPLFMPKAASRILLEITGIKIERVQDITEEGALREGCIAIFDKDEDGLSRKVQSARDVYDETWCSMHGEESWDKNPWVWVIQFKVKSVK